MGLWFKLFPGPKEPEPTPPPGMELLTWDRIDAVAAADLNACIGVDREIQAGNRVRAHEISQRLASTGLRILAERFGAEAFFIELPLHEEGAPPFEGYHLTMFHPIDVQSFGWANAKVPEWMGIDLSAGVGFRSFLERHPYYSSSTVPK